MALRTLLLVILNLVWFAPAVAQHVAFPNPSNVYPDTIAIYWQHESQKTKEQQSVVKLTVRSPFEDLLYEEQVTDSLVMLVVDTKVNEPGFVIELAYVGKNNLPRSERASLVLIDKKPEIAALIDLVHTNASVENLMLLADAYEKEKCFVNALWIYSQITTGDGGLGRQRFLKYYEQGLANRRRQAVLR
jgi:hypothetical protein